MSLLLSLFWGVTLGVAPGESSSEVIWDESAVVYDGAWIVQLKEPSVVKQMKTIERQGRSASPQEKIRFKSQVRSSQTRFEQKIQGLGRKQVRRKFETILNALVIDGLSPQEAQALSRDPDVRNVSPNLKVTTTMVNSAALTQAKRVWPLNRNQQSCGFSANDDYLREATCMNGSGIRLGIIDTGIDYLHASLGGCRGPQCRVKGGWSFFTNDDQFMDDQGHGTHVAGIAAGRGYADNGKPIMGIAPNADLYGIKVLDSTGGGSFESVAAGIEWSIDPNQDGDPSDHLDVINLSIGGPVGHPDDFMSAALDEAVEAGVVAVVAAGNAGPNRFTINSPGTSRLAITVSAMNQQSQLAWFSSKGPSVWRDADRNLMTAMKPEVTAPGVSICAARASQAWSGFVNYCEDQRHVRLSGTSMAAPMVAGAAALILQRNPGLSPQQVKIKLQSSGQRVRDANLGPFEIGAGFLDAYRAVFDSNPADLGASEVMKVGDQIHIPLQGVGSQVRISFARYTSLPKLKTSPFKLLYSGPLTSSAMTVQRPLPRGESFILKIETPVVSHSESGGSSVQYQYFMDEWPICRVEDIVDISRRAAGDYKQICDMEIQSDPEYQIGGFTGNYNGHGRRVIYNIPDGGAITWPLFSLIKPRGTVRNLHIENIRMNTWDVAGALAQYSYGDIEDVFVTGVVQGSMLVGGIVGVMGEPGSIRRSAVRADVGSQMSAGGLVGHLESGANISQSYFKGSIAAGQRAGGLIGEAAGSGQIEISESYVSATLQGGMKSSALVASSSMPISVVSSFWDETLAPDLMACLGQECSGASPRTSSQMTDPETYQNWDFQNVWRIESFQTTPFHRSE
jgi:subtilisin family serine protease